MHCNTRNNKEKENELLDLSNHELSELERTNRANKKRVSSDTLGVTKDTSRKQVQATPYQWRSALYVNLQNW